MTKQVTFAENLKVPRVYQNDIIPRWAGMHDSKRALLSENHVNGLTIQRPSAAGHEPQIQHVTTIHIPKTITAAPFLMHSELTPGQKKYLYTVADAYSTDHVRRLITQHYMNVLHRCTTDYDSERDVDVIPEFGSAHGEREKHPSKAPNRTKKSGQIHHGVRHPKRSILPKISTRQERSPVTSTLKDGKSKIHRTKVPTWKKPSKKRFSSKLLGDEEDLEEEERPDDSLSECMTSLSMEEDDDRLLDIDNDEGNHFPGHY